MIETKMAPLSVHSAPRVYLDSKPRKVVVWDELYE